MSASTKEWISKWFPVIFTLLTNVAVVAYGYGKMDQRLAPMEYHLSVDTTERAMEYFVTKSEFAMRNVTRDKELDEFKQAVRELKQEIRDNNIRLEKILDRLQQVK